MSMRPDTLSKGATIAFRIALVVAIMAGAMIATLKLLETAGEPLREGVQSYLAQLTHSRVYVTALPDPQFFPDVRMKIQNTVFSDIEDPKKKLASVDAIEFSIPFINLLIGRQAFENFNLENLEIARDVLLPRALTITKASLEKEKSVLTMTGKYGAAPLSGQIDLIRRDGDTVYYSLPPHTPFTMTIGDAVIAGDMHSEKEALKLQNVTMSGKGGAKYGPAEFYIVKNQQFIKDNPISCLMDQKADLKLTSSHPCAKLFEQKN